jgi:PAS domain S-box-containing protein
MDQSKDFYDESIYPILESKFSNDLERIESFFSDSETELILYANMVDLSNEDDYIFTILDNFLINNPTFLNSYFTTESGNDYLDNQRKPKVDGRERLWYKQAKLNGFTISNPYVDVLSKEWVVTLSVPVYKNEEFYGVLGVDFLLSDIVSNISNESNISNTRIVIKNDKNDIIFHDESISMDEAKELLTIDTSNQLLKHFKLDKLHLDLYIIYSSKEYHNQVRVISYEMVIILFFIFIITVMLAIITSERISIPLKEFTDAIHHVNETHLTYSSGHNINDWNEEFKKLFSKFNLLVQKFENDKKKLETRFEILSKKNQQLLEKNMELEDLFKNQKLLDRHIRKSQQDYYSILNNINGMVWVVDEKGLIVFVNNSLSEQLGFESENLIGLPLDVLISYEYGSKTQLLSILQQRDYKKIELSINSVENSSILVESSTSRVFDQGKLLYVYGICRDVRASKALHHNYNLKIQEQNLIMDLTETASMNMSLQQVTKSVFSKLNIIFGWSAATIRFLNDNNEFELVSRTTIGNEYVESAPIDYENSCLGYTTEIGEIQYVYEVDDLPVVEPIYKKMIETGYALVLIPVGNNEIGRGVITVTVEKSSLNEKEETLKAFTNTIIIVVERALIYEKLKKDYIRMIKVLAEAGDDKDSSSVGHSNRVAEISRLIGEQLYLDDEEIIDLEVCGLLHDIGKIGISDEYLSKEAQNTLVGHEKIKEHPIIGRRMLENIGLSDNILDGIELHHVNFDLSGYPEVHDIDSIPLFSRIIRIADQFDNIRSNNDFETSKDILYEMSHDSGRLYCPKVIKILMEVVEKDIV